MLLLALFISSVLAQNECYYAAKSRAGSAIIPCGSSGYSACCQIGDLCLSDSACWNPTYNVTYLYGCSDPNYSDATCPWKCGPTFESAPYVGLDYCYNTTQNEWSCTHPPSNSESIQEFPAQQCYDDSIIAFAGPSSLQPILSLPTAVGGSTVWFSQVNPTSYSLDPKYTPTTTSIQVTASVPTTVEVVSTTSGTDISTSSNAPIGGVTASSLTTTFKPTNTGASKPTNTATSTPTVLSESSGLTTGAKVGIGVGVGVGVLGLAALGAAFFLFRRRKPSHQTVSQENNGYPQDIKDSRARPPSELPANAVNFTGYGSVLGTSSTVTNWDSPSPSYAPQEPRRAGPNVMHELG